ncbi:hypothetical protein [Endozoicomonas sp. ONNA2]|uniref:hypothetical protein n=1 Tax=Endozoicomonas sp. ONNA2 TaxID=2828741 RepID=UPI002147E48E|nr:hypothetical protein [Endozoicomonas sp. ONNA2]
MPEFLTFKSLGIIASEPGEVEAPLGQFSKHKAVAICLLPDLPKPVFHHLITASDLPVLTEGANTTSFLLQAGHPYLSTLPDGETPIPQDVQVVPIAKDSGEYYRPPARFGDISNLRDFQELT